MKLFRIVSPLVSTDKKAGHILKKGISFTYKLMFKYLPGKLAR